MKKQTTGRDVLGSFAPKFAELNDDVLFGEVWSREDKLSLKERSIVTVTALITKGIFDNSLRHHIINAKNNGVSAEEMAEIITHISFYAGWPNAWAAFTMAKEIYVGDRETHVSDELRKISDFPLGEENKAFEKYFTGKSYLSHLNDKEVDINNVTFEPGCRTNWHVHHGCGQILICVGGHGWYQESSKDAQMLKSGDVVYIPPEVKHWHGAIKNEGFAHLSLMVPTIGATTEWCEQVTDEEYNKLP